MSDRQSVAAKWAERAYRGLGSPAFRIRLWTGEEVGATPEHSAATIVAHDRAAMLRAFLDAEVQFGQLYCEGRIDVEGDLVALLCAAQQQRSDQGFLRRWLPAKLLERALSNDPRRSVENAQHHYDVSNDFYRLWLDERMVYTCAYYATPDLTLEEAQLAKLDHVCRKLGLRPGESVVEAGCGWGSLALHMARYYGVRVRAFNVSQEQVAYAREEAEKQGLGQRVEFVEDDYRNIEGRYDAFVSVGMLEHVGLDWYERLGALIERSLAPGGRGFLHTIGRSRPQRMNRWIDKHIFPHSHPPSLGEMMRILEAEDLAPLDVENLAPHYARTAQEWLDRYRAEEARIEAMVGRERMRAWRLYLAATTASFRTGALQLYQVLFNRAGDGRAPWTRDGLYAGEGLRFGER